MGRLNELVVLVSGAASGIGQATATRLAQEGASLYLIDVNEAGLAETEAQATEAGASVVTRIVDVRSDEEVAAAVAGCVEHFGGLHRVANIAGVQSWGNTHETPTETFRRDIDINLVGTLVLCREALPHIIECKGAIVNMSSIAASVGIPYSAAYCASKGGVLALTRSLAVEYGKAGVRVNCVCPGGIETDMTTNAWNQFPEGVDMDLIMRAMSLDGFGSPADIAGVVAMLLSDDGRHINGTSITVDGAATA